MRRRDRPVHGRLEVVRKVCADRLRARIYLNGMTEWRHGISNATSFSMTALRAQEILDDIRRGEEPLATTRPPVAASERR